MGNFNEEICLRLAEEVAKEAGGRLQQGLEEYRDIHFEDDRDVKLRADLESEKLIRKRLAEATDYPIIGEEEGGNADLLNEDTPFWVVDPLDGTYNYLREQPQCCVSIGLMRGQDFLMGVIYDFNTEALYSGGQKNSFQINGRPRKLSWAKALGQSCLMTGFPAGREYSSDSLKKFIGHVGYFKKIRMIGSAALALAQVALGSADAYFEESICLWDIAAGAALVKSVGGYVEAKPVGDPKDMKYNVWAIADKNWLKVLKN